MLFVLFSPQVCLIQWESSLIRVPVNGYNRGALIHCDLYFLGACILHSMDFYRNNLPMLQAVKGEMKIIRTKVLEVC